jgi:acetyl coenzyme A synthetase (ADP forming)-like protein
MTTPQPPAWNKTVVLRDGGSLRLRPIGPEDGERLARFHDRLSPQSIYTRFMRIMPKLTAEDVKRFTRLDYGDEMAIVAVAPDAEEPGGERLIAVGRYVRLPKHTHAEVAFTVEDRHQGRGIATHLLQELLPFARMAHIEVLEAEVLAENRRMLDVFNHMGFRVAASLQEGVVHVEFPLAETEQSRESRWAREQAAASASIERIFRPRSVAVVGASSRSGTIGNALVRNLLRDEFNGPVYPVNAHHAVVCSVPCYPALGDIPREVDLAVVAVPAGQVLDVVRQAAAKHIHALVIISAGFAETGPAGRALQEQVLDLARRHGMRVVGPNCLGILNAEPGVRLNATFAPVSPPAGRVALSSQSGALGIAMLGLARELRLGISQFVSVGNKADISGNDLLLFWGEDPHTAVILLYLESFGNPRKFSRIARRVGRKKPVVVLKAGKSQAGARAASSHTGALTSSAVAARSLMEQAGIVQAETMEQFFHAAKVLGSQPLPRGNRLAILTNAGGPAILSADWAESEGLSVPALSRPLQAHLRRDLLPTASVLNPVDMIAGASARHYEAALGALLASDEVDQVLVMFIPPIVTRTADVAGAILNARRASDANKPLVAVMMVEPGAGDAELDRLEGAGIPTFRFPEDAVVALGQLTRYRDWRAAPRGDAPRYADAKPAEAKALLAARTGEDPHREPVWLPPLDSFALLQAYGIPALPVRHAATAAEAAAHAAALGCPVALKLSSATITHKTDVGGVALGLRTPEEARAAFEAMAARLEQAGRRHEMDGALVQPMAPGGLEIVLGMSQDPQFGPVMMVGLGGIYLELFQDVQFALHPVTNRDVSRMIDRLRARPVFDGYRGEAPRDLDALHEAVLRLSQMVEDHPRIKEIDLNPVLLRAKGQGCVTVDARFRVQAVDPFEEYVIASLRA